MLGALPLADVVRSPQELGGIKTSARIKCSASRAQDVGDTIRYVPAAALFHSHMTLAR